MPTQLFYFRNFSIAIWKFFQQLSQHMQQAYSIIPAALLLFWMCSCTTPAADSFHDWMSPNGKIKILCSTAMIEDLVKHIGGERVDTLTLISKGLNPHSYQLVKGDNEKFQRADLVFYNGLGLEHGPSTIAYLKSHAKCISLGDAVYNSHPQRIITLNGEIDPHLWMDVSLWSETIPIISSELVRLDPSHAADYENNAQTLQKQLEQAHLQVLTRMQQLPKEKRYLITSHDAFNYFARAYLAEPEEQHSDLWRQRFASPEGLSPESQLGIKHIQEIIDYLRQHCVKVLFTESNISRDSIKKIAEAAQTHGLQVIVAKEPLFSDDMGEPGSSADTYLKMIQYNTAMIASYLNLN